MKDVFDLVGRVSQATANILITGEKRNRKRNGGPSNSRNGPRANKPFIAINCTAIPETLLESELSATRRVVHGSDSKKRGLSRKPREEPCSLTRSAI